jgi:hypothetical protein
MFALLIALYVWLVTLLAISAVYYAHVGGAVLRLRYGKVLHHLAVGAWGLVAIALSIPPLGMLVIKLKEGDPPAFFFAALILFCLEELLRIGMMKAVSRFKSAA